jgi:APA family basic amino acid/polyamine antiporter
MSNDTAAPQEAGPSEGLRREVSVWGSYMWGFADVGADTYVALGLVMAYAAGATSLAFGLAGLVYILIGLAYTELAATYPVAGGGQYFAARGLGDFWGFVAGSALLLDYTIDIALFSAACAGYVNYFLPYLFGVNVRDFVVHVGPFANVEYIWLLETLFLIVLLVGLNMRGIRESSLLNEVIGVVVIATEVGLVLFGFFAAWRPEVFAFQWRFEFPNLRNFMYGTSLAIISFVGLESISQAAQETRRPATIVPRTSIALIFTVFLFATAFSTLGLGVPLTPEVVPDGSGGQILYEQPWEILGLHQDKPVAVLAQAIPYVGIIAGPLAAALGALILLISANSGVMSASRLTFSMSRFQFISEWFNEVHPKFHTPTRTIIIFSLIAAVQAILASLTGPKTLDTLGNMYAFGASTGYLLVFLALIRLRFADPYSPRPYKVPFNVPVRRGGRTCEFPLLAVLGTIGIGGILAMVVLTHEIGRIAGPLWILACFIYYAWYRRSKGLPVFGTVKRDWEAQQQEVLEEAEEFDLLERYRAALAARDRVEGESGK